jgi:hypothetical protein
LPAGFNTILFAVIGDDADALPGVMVIETGLDVFDADASDADISDAAQVPAKALAMHATQSIRAANKAIALFTLNPLDLQDRR